MGFIRRPTTGGLAALLASALLLAACQTAGTPPPASAPEAEAGAEKPPARAQSDRPFHSQLRTWPAGR